MSRPTAPWFLTFLPNGKDNASNPQDPWHKPRPIPVNSFAPTEFENDHFQGRILLIHETGSEPGNEEDALVDDAPARRGVEFQLQGRFKRASTTGEGSQNGLYIGGELDDALKLGWFTKSIVGMCVKFAKQKCEGRIHCVLGDKNEKAHCAFPIGQIFTVVRTPVGQEPPRLGSPELAKAKWQGPGMIDVNPDTIYTFFYKTPWMDLCSWELLKVPGVSPLPLENLLGDAVNAVHVMFYDLGMCRTHPNWRQSAVLDFAFRRGQPGDVWAEEVPEGCKTPLDELSDPSEASEVDDDEQADADEDDQHSEDHSESETGSEDDIDEDEDMISRADSQALDQIDAWRPRPSISLHIDEGVSVLVPYYIEAIDRRRHRRTRVWYVFALTDRGGGSAWWHARETAELRSLCRPRPRMRSFRRGAARYVMTVNTLEMFRQVICGHLSSETKLRNIVINSAASVLQSAQEDTDKDLDFETRSSRLKNGVKNASLRNKTPLLPPRFFVTGSSKAVELAFAHAREGRAGISAVVREGVVGAIHFEGRLCEELLRFSKDGTLRSFTPYNCDKPRLQVSQSQIRKCLPIEGLFLGRFHLWEVHTDLRVFVFCSADEEDRNGWVACISPNTVDFGMSRGVLGWSTEEIATMLKDTTRARRWRPKHRLVLNDRKLLFVERVQPPAPSMVEGMLSTVLEMPEKATLDDVITFMDNTCTLKAVRFEGWTLQDKVAFWINVYHCLLQHGILLLGPPKSRREVARFYSRVSYLVGSAPVSLREIERFVLHVPSPSLRDQMRGRGQAKAKQALTQGQLLVTTWCFCPCRRRAPARNARGREDAEMGGGRSSGSSSSSSVKVDKAEKTAETAERASGGRGGPVVQPVVEGKGVLDIVNAGNMRCLPALPGLKMKVGMPAMPRPWRYDGSACLFLGRAREGIELNEALDVKVAFCLNRCNKSCPPEIPLFSATCLDAQLNEVSKRFLEQFMDVEEQDGPDGREVSKVYLPYICLAMKRELDMDTRSLLDLCWQFTDRAPSSSKTQIRFLKYRSEPRRRKDLSKLSYSDPSLDVVATMLGRAQEVQGNSPVRLVSHAPGSLAALGSPEGDAPGLAVEVAAVLPDSDGAEELGADEAALIAIGQANDDVSQAIASEAPTLPTKPFQDFVQL